MSMLDSLLFNARQREQQAQQEQARQQRQQALQAEARARAEILAAEMVKACSGPTEAPAAPIPDRLVNGDADPGQPSRGDAPNRGITVSESSVDSRAYPHAGAVGQAPMLASRNIPNGAEFDARRPGGACHYDRIIDELATLTTNFPNAEAWPMLLQGAKVRGLSPVEATALRPRIWKRRKELLKAQKSRLRAAARGD